MLVMTTGYGHSSHVNRPLSMCEKRNRENGPLIGILFICLNLHLGNTFDCLTSLLQLRWSIEVANVEHHKSCGSVKNFHLIISPILHLLSQPPSGPLVLQRIHAMMYIRGSAGGWVRAFRPGGGFGSSMQVGFKLFSIFVVKLKVAILRKHKAFLSS